MPLYRSNMWPFRRGYFKFDNWRYYQISRAIVPWREWLIHNLQPKISPVILRLIPSSLLNHLRVCFITLLHLPTLNRLLFTTLHFLVLLPTFYCTFLISPQLLRPLLLIISSGDGNPIDIQFTRHLWTCLVTKVVASCHLVQMGHGLIVYMLVFLPVHPKHHPFALLVLVVFMGIEQLLWVEGVWCWSGLTRFALGKIVDALLRWMIGVVALFRWLGRIGNADVGGLTDIAYNLRGGLFGLVFIV